jgi:hypothetical protein
LKSAFVQIYLILQRETTRLCKNFQSNQIITIKKRKAMLKFKAYATLAPPWMGDT